MNFSSLIGITFGISIMYFALAATNPDISFFFDMHGVLIVCGGTLAAASISFPLRDVVNLLKVFFLRVLGKHHLHYQEIIQQLIDLNKKAANGVTGLQDSIPGLKHEFLKEAVALVSGGVLSEIELKHILEQRVKTIEKRYMYEANMFRTLGRYPPAFGLLATTLGMISLLQKIGQPDSQKLIGPAMSIGLIGTLYGIAIANLILNPIAENLTELTHEEMALRRMIMEGALLLKGNVNPVLMRERLNSYLMPKHRVVRKASGAS